MGRTGEFAALMRRISRQASRKLLLGLMIRTITPRALRLLALGSWSRVSCQGATRENPLLDVVAEDFLTAVSRQA
jgi:hypothetical protein